MLFRMKSGIISGVMMVEPGLSGEGALSRAEMRAPTDVPMKQSI